jgi:ferredoxin--NADP+ reductase
MSESWLAGSVVDRRMWAEGLFSLRVAVTRSLSFEAGQFARIGLDPPDGGERVARPFTFVNPPQESTLEFLGVAVKPGSFSSSLGRLAPGDRLHVSDLVAGAFVLSKIDDARTLWLMATGTGVAPYLSMLRTEEPWRRFSEIVLVRGVRHAADRCYGELFAELARTKGLRVVDLVSREPCAGALEGRIPAAILDGRLEQAAGTRLSPETSRVFLCGNPAMIEETADVLQRTRGMRRHRPRAPGHMMAEAFWSQAAREPGNA